VLLLANSALLKAAKAAVACCHVYDLLTFEKALCSGTACSMVAANATVAHWYVDSLQKIGQLHVLSVNIQGC
jgi:hypothetical protein